MGKPECPRKLKKVGWSPSANWSAKIWVWAKPCCYLPSYKPYPIMFLQQKAVVGCRKQKRFPNSSCLKEGFDLVLQWILTPSSINSQSKTSTSQAVPKFRGVRAPQKLHTTTSVGTCPPAGIITGESWPAAPLSCSCTAQPQSSSQSTERMERTGRGEEILWWRDWEEELRIQTKQPVFLSHLQVVPI